MDRTIAFSDAVFAVVITVLVLGIEIPSDAVLSGPELVVERAKLLHQLLIYVVAFWMVAMYWSQHALFFGGLQKIDRRLFVLNLTFLLPVTLLPFLTQFMGTKRDDWRSVLVFGLTNLFAAFVLERMWRWAEALPEIHQGPQTVMLAKRIRRGVRIFGTIVILGILVSRLDVRAGTLLFLLLPIVHFYGYIRDPLRSRSSSSSPEESD